MRSSAWPRRPEPHDGSVYVIAGNKNTLIPQQMNSPSERFPTVM